MMSDGDDQRTADGVGRAESLVAAHGGVKVMDLVVDAYLLDRQPRAMLQQLP